MKDLSGDDQLISLDAKNLAQYALAGWKAADRRWKEAIIGWMITIVLFAAYFLLNKGNC
jgi:hypothetical protein